MPPMTKAPARQKQFLAFKHLRAGRKVATFAHLVPDASTTVTADELALFGETALVPTKPSPYAVTGSAGSKLALEQLFADSPSGEECVTISHGHGSTMVAVDPLGAFIGGDALRSVVELLERVWVDDTRFSSSLADMAQHPTVATLAALGRAVFPIGVERARVEPELWSQVLGQITGAQPLGPDVTREQAGDVWAAWGAEHGWL